MNKYQESLDWIKLQLIGGNEDWFEKRGKCVGNLQELIDKYERIKYPKFVPCKCGYNRRNGIYDRHNDKITYICKKCGATVVTEQFSEVKAIRHWNEVMSNE